MNPSTIAVTLDLTSKSELDRVFALCAVMQINGKTEFLMSDVVEWFDELNYARPNTSRLLGRIRKDRRFIKAGTNGFKVSAKSLVAFKASEQFIGVKPEPPPAPSGFMLPPELYENTRGYIEKICRQIESTYVNSSFDACSMMMRRLVEVLLILAYQNEGCESEIIKPGTTAEYLALNKIISNTVTQKKFKLGKSALGCLDTFRALGNLSAHEIHYNARKSEIDNEKSDFRVCIEELLYKSGVK